jgi:hypothetical protein
LEASLWEIEQTITRFFEEYRVDDKKLAQARIEAIGKYWKEAEVIKGQLQSAKVVWDRPLEEHRRSQNPLSSPEPVEQSEEDPRLPTNNLQLLSSISCDTTDLAL